MSRFADSIFYYEGYYTISRFPCPLKHVSEQQISKWVYCKMSVRCMGYERFGCVRKDYSVGHLFFCLIHLLSSFVGYSGWKGMNHRKETRIHSNSIFNPTFTTISWSRNIFLRTGKIAGLLVEVSIRIWEGVSFLVRVSQYFQTCIDCPFCQRPPRRLLFFVFIYFLFCLFYFNLISFHFIGSFFYFYLLFNPCRCDKKLLKLNYFRILKFKFKI